MGSRWLSAAPSPDPWGDLDKSLIPNMAWAMFGAAGSWKRKSVAKRPLTLSQGMLIARDTWPPLRSQGERSNDE